MKKTKEEETLVFALGGLGEVGKNMYVVMYENEIIVVDAGITFPEDDLLGIDYVLPDFTFLKQNEKKIRALLITHGHEDHIGAIPFLLQTVNIPVIYAPKQAAALIRKKIDEKNINFKNLVVYEDDTKIKFKNLDIEFFRTTHSIPDSHGISINTPNGRVVLTGDFKFDMTPIGPVADLHKMAEIGKKGVKLLMSDSTNALIEGSSLSESKVDEALGDIFDSYPNNRIIVTTFASNIYRLKHIIETCRKHGRKVALFGRSMETSVDIAIECGYIKNSKIIVTAEEANRMKPSEVCLLCTGSQGEPLTALSKIADGTHRQISLLPNDIVVFSSSPIPGNGASISRTINKLYLKGVKVFTNSTSSIHTSGHAQSEELKLMIRLLKPEYFAPYHGEYRMLKKHTDIAELCGVKKENTFVLENGEILAIGKNSARKKGHVPADDIYVDGNRIGDVGNIVIKDRKLMSSNGVLVAIVNIDNKNKLLLAKPTIATRGFILVNENEELLREIETNLAIFIEKKLKDQKYNLPNLKNDIIGYLSPFLQEKTGRSPIILPIIMEISKIN